MLNPRTIEIVKATVPILEQHGELLTRHFYTRMFRHNPEVAPLFNPSHQAAGTQQNALAAAICAYAANIDNLEVLGGAVELIAQKHASLRILPEHYPIVGANLLGSIADMLGERATDEVLAAWEEAYGFLADILIARERQIYSEHAGSKHGWEGFKLFRITRKAPESEIITSFYLEPVSGEGVPLFQPGQYLTVRVPHPRNGTTMRNYSISSAPGGGCFRISVKRESEGFASNYLHGLPEGSEIEVGPPCGEFFLDPTEHDERPLALLSAGVGVTPMLSMLLSTLDSQPGRDIHFIHGALNGRTHAFRDLVRDLSRQHRQLKVHYRYNKATVEDQRNQHHDSEGLIDAVLLESLLPTRDADYYFCGPKPFMIAIYQVLRKWGIPASQVHFEFFGPRQELESVAASAIA
ncbi:MAG: NO-inducible flavohemoprotein [Methylacidiphilaceae bacterium]|nr:NO-inducible flavohemoprotein [Candidatus Methylacidiphilaceae bacterium]